MKQIFLTLLLILPSLGKAAVALTAAPGSKASFEAVGRPSLLKIKGEGASVTGRLQVDANKVSGRFEVDVDQFDTGIDLRNRHMKENYLKTKEFPKAVLSVLSVQLPAGWNVGKELKEAPFKGELTLKGVTKPVEGKVNATGDGLETEAKFQISLNDFDVGVPKYMGVTVADTVNVAVRIPGFQKTIEPAAATPAPPAPVKKSK